jgi:outer membrane biosynthesis protein TonB
MPEETSRPQPEPPRPESVRREPTPTPATTTPQPEPERPQPQVDQRALFPGADQRTTDRQDQGQTGTPGNQGRPQGALDGEGTQGVGQGGVEFSLTGRRANSLPLPEYTAQAQGLVVVTVIVNRQGQVVRATAGARGTTTSNQELWRRAEEAARRARFDVSTNAPEEQTGTITYNFIRLN